jgi:hypothetical protein
VQIDVAFKRQDIRMVLTHYRRDADRRREAVFVQTIL